MTLTQPSPAPRVINADTLRREIFARGMTQKEFSKVAQLNRQTLTAALHGRPVKPSTLRQIIKALSKFERIAEGLA